MKDPENNHLFRCEIVKTDSDSGSTMVDGFSVIFAMVDPTGRPPKPDRPDRFSIVFRSFFDRFSLFSPPKITEKLSTMVEIRNPESESVLTILTLNPGGRTPFVEPG